MAESSQLSLSLDRTDNTTTSYHRSLTADTCCATHAAFRVTFYHRYRGFPRGSGEKCTGLLHNRFGHVCIVRYKSSLVALFFWRSGAGDRFKGEKLVFTC